MNIRLAKKIPGAKILVETVSGEMLVLNHRFAHRDDAKLFETLTRIREAGKINRQHWRTASSKEF